MSSKCAVCLPRRMTGRRCRYVESVDQALKEARSERDAANRELTKLKEHSNREMVSALLREREGLRDIIRGLMPEHGAKPNLDPMAKRVADRLAARSGNGLAKIDNVAKA